MQGDLLFTSESGMIRGEVRDRLERRLRGPEILGLKEEEKIDANSPPTETPVSLYNLISRPP